MNQGSATAALTWVVYDVFLSLDREILSVWGASWSISKVLFLLSRYHTILALGFFLMEAIGTKHFTLPLNIDTQHIPIGSGFYAQISNSIASRWYLGLTEVFSILTGELLILIRINALYGWSRKIVVLTLFLFCAETVIGLVTTIQSVRGGWKGLMGSTGILNCAPGQANIPDVNVARIYLGLIVRKAITSTRDIEVAYGRKGLPKFGFLAAFKSSPMTPTLYLCLRDAALYFVLVFGVLLVNLVLIIMHDRYAQLGTPWLLGTYSVASTRIFLNLKDLTQHHNEMTWSEFQLNSAIEFQTRSELGASHEMARTVRNMRSDRVSDDTLLHHLPLATNTR
ncbi:hypothetical protein DFH08DRAFT_1075495 [Mycena albidolilacea]|uniref:DUF6533 domain-containing protein n=1 Tax=Mycena albidolilacea TaxID=1033008 RepID=A0AAD7AGZ1_9AGAR|nr:hypothetical protein DFH08DRAFT_1075495 [Mycena albidolilacea]